jgi:intergrase/recombinase
MCLCSLLKTSASDNIVAASRKTSKHPLSSTFKNMAKRGRADEKKWGRGADEEIVWGRTDEEMLEEMKKWDAAVKKKAADEARAKGKKAAKKAQDSMLKTLKFLRKARNMAAGHEGTEKYAKAVRTLVGIMQSLGMGMAAEYEGVEKYEDSDADTDDALPGRMP